MAKYTDKQKVEAVKAYRKGTGGLGRVNTNSELHE